MITNLVDQLVRDEGLRLFPYIDTEGKTTIGIGRNLTDCGISLTEAKGLLTNDVQAATIALEKQFPWVAVLDAVRYDVLRNMAFNMGIRRLAEFVNFLGAMQTGDWATAKQEMLHSLWARQVGPRALRLATQIETGIYQ